MYKLLLILKYLRKRRIAWVSLVAVMLCTTMVLVVISVMGGWLRMFRSSFHSISGDVIVEGRSMLGFPYYQEMMQKIEALPEVQAAAPVIRTYGLINVNNQIRNMVQVIGYPANIGQVNGFADSLHRLKGTRDLAFSLWPDRAYRRPYGFSEKSRDPRTWPGMIVGSGVIGLRKDKDGNIERPDFMYDAYVILTMMPLTPEKATADATDKVSDTYWIIDDSRTKVSINDSNTVYVPFAKLQRDLQMDGGNGEPARTRDIQVALKPGADLEAARARIRGIADQVTRAHGGMDSRFQYSVNTWQETHGQFLAAVENEKGLVTMLFGIISIVAVFLVFCIFYMIVVEKTKDIGIIKSVGASSAGVAQIFLGYGLAIGIVGGALGLLLSWLIVHYINQLHSLLGQYFGLVIWKPETYLFDTIPNTMDPKEVTIIVIVAVISAVLGALVPAWRAAQMHPVEALRWE
jgi:lipoprotein-releasing system permease protein